jgi:hypothetical protein
VGNQDKIINGFKDLFGDKTEVFSGTVVSVDEQEGTIEVQLTGSDLEVPVMLRSATGDLRGIVPIPEENTEVVVCTIDGGSEFTLVRAAKLKKVLINVPDLVMSCDLLTINNGENGALPILGKIQANLDAIKAYAEATKEAVAIGLDAVGVGSAASGTLGKTAFEGAMAGRSINFQGMGNDKIKH